MSGEVYHYCMVGFGDRKLYAYLTNGLPVQIGSRVWVPYGKVNQEREGVVLSIMDCTREMAPWPPEKTKAVLRIAPAPTEQSCPLNKAAEPQLDPSAAVLEDQQADLLPESHSKGSSAETVHRTDENPVPKDMDQVQIPTADPGKNSSWKVAICTLVAVLCVVVGITVYQIADGHYRQAEEYLVADQLSEAENELTHVPGSHKNAKEMVDYLTLCKLAESGTEADYKTALDGMEVLISESGEPLTSAVKKKYDSINAAYHDLLYQTGCVLLEKKQYENAQNYLSRVSDYPYVSELLCYAQASEVRTGNSSTYLKGMLQSLEQIPVDYTGPFTDDISMLRANITHMIAVAEAREQKAAEDRRAAEEARQAAEKKAEEERVAALKASGIPYVGMAESEINSTRQLGKAGYAGTDSDYIKGSDGKHFRDTWQVYAWYNTDGNMVFKACCRDGVVTSVEKFLKDSCWSGDKLLVKLGPFKPKTFHYGGGSSKDDGAGGGHSLRDEYDSPEDLFEDGGYDDLDEAWDEWEEGW